MEITSNESYLVSAHPHAAEFWVINTTRRQLMAIGRKYRLSVRRIQKYGRVLHLTADGNFNKWIYFIIRLQKAGAILVRSSVATAKYMSRLILT